MANTASDTLLTNTDKVLLGFIAGPVLVSKYALTLFLPLAVQGLVLRIISGAIPGIGKLFGLHEYSKISKVWVVMNHLIFLVSTSAGVTILLFNQSFLHVWVGEGHFAGGIANLIIIVMVMQDTFIKHDGFIISATLDLKKKVYLTFRSLLLFAVPGVLLVNNFGIEGLCLSLVFGKFSLFVGQRLLLKGKLQHNLPQALFLMIQPLATSIIMLGSAFYLSTSIGTLNLAGLVGLAPVTFVLTFLIFYTVGLRKEQKTELAGIVSSIKLFKPR